MSITALSLNNCRLQALNAYLRPRLCENKKKAACGGWPPKIGGIYEENTLHVYGVERVRVILAIKYQDFFIYDGVRQSVA